MFLEPIILKSLLSKLFFDIGNVFWKYILAVSFDTKAGLLMGDDISSGLSSMAVCFNFHSTNVVHLIYRNLYFYQFWCHHPLIAQTTVKLWVLAHLI